MMTLSKQLMCVIFTLFSLVFIGTFTITLENSRLYFSEQLNSNAQDTATSLGLSLSAKMKQDDKASMLAMVDAIFDRGYFSRVSVSNIKGDVLINRFDDSDIEGVPAWFRQIVRLPVSSAEALLMSGWQQIGKVMVESDPSFAYRDLWKNSTRLFYWYVFLMMLTFMLSIFALRYLLTPLKTVTQQAKAICEQKFPIQSPLPRTLELRQLSQAMNKMVKKLKSLFADHAKKTEQLRAEAFQDPLTGQGNRVLFDQQLTHILRSDDDFRDGSLLLIELQGLAEFNHQHGYQQGDQLIVSIAKALNSIYQANDAVPQFRIAGGCFACVVFDTDADVIQSLNQQVIDVLRAIITQADSHLGLHIGAVKYALGMSTGELLSLADQALARARSQGECAAYQYVHHSSDAVITATKWREVIATALDQDRIKYASQVVKGDDDRVFHQEVLVKLIDSQDRVINAAQFVPICEKYTMADKLDLTVIEHVTEHILIHTPSEPLALNLTRQSVGDEGFIAKLLQIVERLPLDKRSLLQFELSEATALGNIQSTSKLIAALNLLSVSVGLDRVGANFVPLDYLDHLAIKYVKIDGSFGHDIEDNVSKQYFIKQLTALAAMMEVEVIACHIETEQSWHILKSMGLVWGQGYYFGQPQDLSQSPC